MKKHVKAIMTKKGYTFLGSTHSSSIVTLPRTSKVPAKYMIFKKPGVPHYIFIHCSIASGIHMIKTASFVYKRPLRGGGFTCRYKMVSRSISSPHKLHSIIS